jgi:sugar PTS system EIIA component
MFGLFQKEKSSHKKIDLLSPVNGRCFNLAEIPDQAFSSGMMGDGFGVESSDGVMYAPADGEILQIFPTKHAILLKTRDGLELLLHIGVDTVTMNGEGFTAHIQRGSKVKTGDKLISFDKALIKEKAKTDLSAIIIANMDLIEQLQIHYGNMNKHSKIASITLK